MPIEVHIWCYLCTDLTVWHVFWFGELIPAHCGKQSKCIRSKIKQTCTLHNAGMRDDKEFFVVIVLWWYKSAIGGFFCTVGRGYLLPRQLLSCSSNKCWYAIASQRGFFLFARNLNFYWKLWANFLIQCFAQCFIHFPNICKCVKKTDAGGLWWAGTNLVFSLCL